MRTLYLLIVLLALPFLIIGCAYSSYKNDERIINGSGEKHEEVKSINAIGNGVIDNE